MTDRAAHIPGLVSDSVPGRANYSLRYLKGGRVFSFAHQIHSVLSFEPQTVLEVGVGSGVVTAALRAAGLHVTTLDIQPDLGPNIVGSVTAMPLKSAAAEVGVCCQVLEHLPFAHFAPALIELHRVVERGLVLSLPDHSRYLEMRLRLPRLSLRMAFSPRRLLAHSMPIEHVTMGHHWEIGYRGYALSRITDAIRNSGWRIHRTWRVSELPWHRFFMLCK